MLEDEMLGEKLGSYHIVDELGAGGMGVVYVAQHELLGHKTAIKFLHPEMSKNAEVVQRFFNEALAATKIDHPSIVKVFDFGHHPNGSAYIIMEYMDGESLGARLRKVRPLSPHIVTTLGAQMAGTLAAAHHAGIVHRDLKPDNIFLVPDPIVPGGERVKILDFGIAKLSVDLHDSGQRTKTGSVLGTPYYMSPEQCRGAGEVDHRSDIYALGCVLFEMACGRVPFPGEGLGEILGAHQHVPPPALRAINPAAPPSLEALILRLLAKRADDRLQTMREVAGELERIGHGFSAGDLAMAATALPRASLPAPPSYAGLATPTPTPGPAYGATPPAGVPYGAYGAIPPTTLGTATGQRHAATLGQGPPSAHGKGLLITGLAFALVAGAGVGVFVLVQKKGQPDAPGPGATGSAASGESGERGTDSAEAAAAAANPWIRIAAAPSGLILGVGRKADAQLRGFRPGRAITAPTAPFEIQKHEVSWGEIDPWLAVHEPAFARPAWVPTEAAARASWPATAIPWQLAQDYCQSFGARLPAEEEWELAARGAALRPYAWGDARLDLDRTRAYAGGAAHVVAVMTSDQDRTPEGVHDLMGNAQEWTADLWREDEPDHDESWVQAENMTFRAVRGLPVAADPPRHLPEAGAAHRETLCSFGACMDGAKEILSHVGLRCARQAR
jgi:serine/threonine-protein kinase